MDLLRTGTSGYTPVTTEESLPEAPPPTTATDTAIPMMQVTAPASLPEDYQLQVSTSTGTQIVTVPPGGVEQGQVFAVPIGTLAPVAAPVPAAAPAPAPMRTPNTNTTTTTNNNNNNTIDTSTAASNDIHIPQGYWRDGWCNFFRYGVCHPHCWTSLFCTLFAVGQVQRRLRLHWSGMPTSDPVQRRTSHLYVMGAFVAYMTIHVVISVCMIITDPCNPAYHKHDPDFDMDTCEHPQAWEQWAVFWYFVHRFYLLSSTAILIRTRTTVRKMYNIPAEHGTCEDGMCGVFCGCCVAAQMLRHTADYKRYPAAVCNETGLIGGPEIV